MDLVAAIPPAVIIATVLLTTRLLWSRMDRVDDKLDELRKDHEGLGKDVAALSDKLDR